MKTPSISVILAFGGAVCGLPVTNDPAAKELQPADIQAFIEDSQLNNRGLLPVTIVGPTFHPALLPRVRPAAQAITIASHALLMTAWIDAQNRLNLILDAAFPGLHGQIIAGVQTLHNGLGVLPHMVELGKTYVVSDNGAEIEPGDTWRWSWFK